MNFCELESCLSLNQTLIDNLLRQARLNNMEDVSVKNELNRLNKQRNKIISLIEEKLDETFI